METAKESMVKIIESQPDDASYEDIFQELVLRIIIDRGIKDSEAERIISNEEVKKRINTWSK